MTQKILAFLGMMIFVAWVPLGLLIGTIIAIALDRRDALKNK